MAPEHKKKWLPALKDLGYSELLPCPVNNATQAFLASIVQPEIHQMIQDADEAMIPEQGPYLLETLGIEEWSHIFGLANDGLTPAIERLQKYIDDKQDIIDKDINDLALARQTATSIALALDGVFDDSCEQVIDITTPNNAIQGLASQVRSNHFINLKFLSETERADVNSLIDITENSQRSNESLTDNGDQFVPCLPLRVIELDVSNKDCMMWKIQNINQLAPISTDMWMCFASISPMETQECIQRAIHGRRISKKHSWHPEWPLKMFKGKYTCEDTGVEVLVKLNLETDNGREDRHKFLFWNWQRPYIRCRCKGMHTTCKGQVIWLDHAIWYIFNHLEEFFSSQTLQGKLASFLVFLSTIARTAVKEHISFMFTRSYMIEAALEYSKKPHATLLSEHGNAAGIRYIERLIKPAEFSASNDVQNNKRKWDLNTDPNNIASANATGMFKSYTPLRARGRAQLLQRNSPHRPRTPGHSHGYRGRGPQKDSHRFSGSSSSSRSADLPRKNFHF